MATFWVLDVEAQFIGLRLPEGKKRVEIPFEVHNNLIIVPVRVNRSLPLKFILDTGVRSSILLDKDYADLLGLEYLRKITIAGVGDTKIVEAYVTNVASVELPGTICEGQSILVLDSDSLDLKSHIGVEVHGIIGYEVFSRFVVEINYALKRLVLYEKKYFKPRRSWSKVDIEILDTKPYARFPVWFNEDQALKAKLLIDTGASHALVLFEPTSPVIRLPEPNIHARLGQGLSGEIYGHLARIDYVKMGDYCLDEVIVSFPDEETYSDSLSVVKRNGTLGGEILSKYTVIFDYFDSKMYLKKNHKYNDSFEYNMSGIDFVAKGTELNRFVVNKIRPGSPAEEAGVKVNDVILVVNGQRSKDYNLSQLYNLMNSREGRKIKIIVEREGLEKRLKFKFRLEREI